MLVGFDRGGWSPTLFADLDAAGFDTLTWRKGTIADIDEALFGEHTHTDEHGRTHTWALADTEVELDIADGPAPARCSRCARSACSTRPGRGRCTS